MVEDEPAQRVGIVPMRRGEIGREKLAPLGRKAGGRSVQIRRFPEAVASMLAAAIACLSRLHFYRCVRVEEGKVPRPPPMSEYLIGHRQRERDPGSGRHGRYVRLAVDADLSRGV